MIKLGDLYAEPGVAPTGWQVQDPARGESFGPKPPVRDSPDLRRVLALPRRPQVEPGTPRAAALIQLMDARFGRARTDACRCREIAPRRFLGGADGCIRSLNYVQAWSLYELGVARGLVGMVAVGAGKSLMDLLAPIALAHGETDPGKFECALLVPPNLVEQLINEYRLAGEHFVMPTLTVHGRKDHFEAGPRLPILHVVPYSRLQRPEATVLLQSIRPRAIIADEVHAIRNADAVRTGRVLRYFAANPETMLAGWTGSITDGSVRDYVHVAALALRERSPVPLDPEVGKEWASALDPKSDWPADPGALLDGLVASGCQFPGEHVHRGFRRRLVETEGVVATRSSSITSRLEILQRAAPPIPDDPVEDERAPGGWWPGLATMLATVRETGIRPDGEVLEDPLQRSRVLRELALGFFYRWIYPSASDEDRLPGGLIDRWFAARSAYRWEVREALKNRRDHMDSPYLCQLAAMRHHGDIGAHDVVEVVDEATGELVRVDVGHLPAWPSEHWPAWRDIRDLVEHETEVVRISDYLARDAAAWARENLGVVWYDKSAFGAWVSEISGLPMHAGGQGAEQRLIGGEHGGVLHSGEDGSRSIVCSIKSHGTGRDGLQRLFCTQLIASPPSSGTTWEQLLGRIHRIGQPSSIVHAFFYCHTEEFVSCYQQALSRAAYAEATIGAAQKLNRASDVESDLDLDFLK